jgi:hypothetical protein
LRLFLIFAWANIQNYRFNPDYALEIFTAFKMVKYL